MKRLIALLSVVFVVISLWGQAPKWYYNDAVGKSGEELKTAIKNVINPHTVISYDNVWIAYKYTDVNADGYISDIYTDCNFIVGENQCKQTSGTVCVCYNREHAFCQSWFKTTTTDNAKMPMYTDVFHLYPTDGKVNSTRNNNPYGETNSDFTSIGTGKLGVCDFPTPGYTGKIFEPSDEYKGDLARTYFYFFICYADSVPTWVNCPIITDGEPSKWAVDMLLRWNTEDPVSQKEINRNNAVYKIQLNRNPFIDYPELANKMFGDDKTAFMTGKTALIKTIYYEDCGNPTIITPVASHKWSALPSVTYTGTADVRSTIASSKYATASGAGNIWLANGNKYIQIDGINTTGYSDVFLSFGLRCEQKDARVDMLVIEYSVDGITWTPMTISAGFPLSSGWSQVMCNEVLPSTRNLRLKIKNSQNSTYQFRLDDMLIRGLITSQTPSTSMYFIGDASDTPNTYMGKAIVNIVCNDVDAVIRYSLDETSPSIIYREPFTLSETSTILTIAHNPELEPSEQNADMIIINPLDGVNDPDEVGNYHIKVYFDGNKIKIFANEDISDISVYDVAGRHVCTFLEINSPTYTVNKNLKQGIYIIQILTKSNRTISKQIVL